MARCARARVRPTLSLTRATWARALGLERSPRPLNAREWRRMARMARTVAGMRGAAAVSPARGGSGDGDRPRAADSAPDRRGVRALRRDHLHEGADARL